MAVESSRFELRLYLKEKNNMKNKTLSLLKKTASALLVAVMLVGVSVVSVQAGDPQKEAGKSLIRYEGYELAEFKEGYQNNNVAPEPSADTKDDCPQGYVFGGWFTLEDDDTYFPVTDKRKVEAEMVYAKFVPAYVMGVKCQNIADTTAESPVATMKFVSAMDSPNYQSYNFKVSAVRVHEDGTFERNDDITDQSTVVNQVAGYTYKVYKNFLVYGTAGNENPVKYVPSDLFGPEAQYFTTWGIENIQKKSYDKIICIEPSWTTLDGTVVQGLTKYAHVEDGFVKMIGEDKYRYVNVPINLRQVKTISGDGVAAGVLSIGYSADDDLVFDKVESGRFFEEMAWAPKTNSVKLVGNTLSIEDKNQNDVYANIRFLKKVPENPETTVINGLNFTISDVDFSDSSENQYNASTYPVWNIKY